MNIGQANGRDEIVAYCKEAFGITSWASVPVTLTFDTDADAADFLAAAAKALDGDVPF